MAASLYKYIYKTNSKNYYILYKVRQKKRHKEILIFFGGESLFKILLNSHVCVFHRAPENDAMIIDFGQVFLKPMFFVFAFLKNWEVSSIGRLHLGDALNEPYLLIKCTFVQVLA